MNLKVNGEFLYDLSANDFDFDSADIIINAKLSQTDEHRTKLEAFKSANNDLILSSSELKPNDYAKLVWSSFGHAKLVKSSREGSPIGNVESDLLHFNDEGFFVYVETLSETYQKLLMNAIIKKHSVNVSHTQIVDMPLESFNCKLEFWSNNRSMSINGKANDFDSHPYRIDFHAPLLSNERIKFENRIKRGSNDTNDLLLPILCNLTSRSMRIQAKENTLLSKFSKSVTIYPKDFTIQKSSYEILNDRDALTQSKISKLTGESKKLSDQLSLLNKREKEKDQRLLDQLSKLENKVNESDKWISNLRVNVQIEKILFTVETTNLKNQLSNLNHSQIEENQKISEKLSKLENSQKEKDQRLLDQLSKLENKVNESDKWISNFKHKILFKGPIYLNGVRGENHFNSTHSLNSSTECFQECKKNTVCDAITFDKRSKGCFFYRASKDYEPLYFEPECVSIFK